MLKMKAPVVLAVVTAWMFAAVPALAWNGEGHQLIAWIAEERLTPKAKAGVQELLGDASLSDAEVASWADEIRRERRATAPWHYVNIPVDSNGYDAKRDGRGGDNVIDAVSRFRDVLANRKASKDDRAEALKFVVHFVGDIHQPLHCADRNGDKGGNTRLVFFPGQRQAVSLHAVWDTFLLRSSKGKRSVSEFGGQLNRRITPKDAKAWAGGTPEQWAGESWRLARDAAYSKVPPDGPPISLTDEYVVRNSRVVDEQIQRAGVRLAVLLNEALR